MKIFIAETSNIGQNGERDSMEHKLTRALHRFSHRIDRVDVAIGDENGPKGGIDKTCRIRVKMIGLASFVARAKDEQAPMALAKAMVRARRIVVSSLKRRRAQRDQLRRQHARRQAVRST